MIAGLVKLSEFARERSEFSHSPEFETLPLADRMAYLIVTKALLEAMQPEVDVLCERYGVSDDEPDRLAQVIQLFDGNRDGNRRVGKNV